MLSRIFGSSFAVNNDIEYKKSDFREYNLLGDQVKKDAAHLIIHFRKKNAARFIRSIFWRNAAALTTPIQTATTFGKTTETKLFIPMIPPRVNILNHNPFTPPFTNQTVMMIIITVMNAKTKAVHIFMFQK